MDIKKAMEMASERLRLMAPRGWEVFGIQSRRSSVEVKSGEVEARSTSKAVGLSIRAMRPARIGFSYTSDLNDRAIEEAVENAMSAARESTEDELLAILPKPDGAYPKVDIYDPDFETSNEAELERRALAMEAEAFATDKNIARTRSAQCSESVISVNIYTSTGIEESYQSSICDAQIMVVAEANGEAEASWEDGFSKKHKELKYKEVGRKAALDAASLLGGKPIKSQVTPAIVDAMPAGEMLGLLARAACADQVAKGRSLLAGKVGKKIFSEKVTILDDSLLPGAIGTKPFDGEGFPARTTTVAENGTLTGYLYDSYWAKKLNETNTGNSRREGFTSKPVIGINNFFLKPGGKNQDELIKDMGEGFLITRMMGVHTANPVTGDFSFGAQGHWIKGGRIEFPVGSVAVSGNILELFENIDEVGNDMKFLGRVGSPSILIKAVHVGGR